MFDPRDPMDRLAPRGPQWTTQGCWVQAPARAGLARVCASAGPTRTRISIGLGRATVSYRRLVHCTTTSNLLSHVSSPFGLFLGLLDSVCHPGPRCGLNVD